MIEELLEEEPNSKCEPHLLSINSSYRMVEYILGCLESLVQYRLQLIENGNFGGDGTKLKEQCLEHLGTLQRLDPLRERRYASVMQRLLASGSS